MTNDFNNYYQYDSCIARGICSINPRTSSLMEVIVLYLKTASYYALKLKECGKEDLSIRNLILNTISVMVSNPEFSEKDFEKITLGFNEELPRIIKSYTEFAKQENKMPDFLKTDLNWKEPKSIIESLRLGEKEFLNKIKTTPQKLLDMYKILFVLAKSICINILYTESYEKKATGGYEIVLQILDKLKETECDEEEIKNFIIIAAQKDKELMNNLHSVQIKRYGNQRENKVSYTTEKGKGILVAGANIRELEYILDSLQNNNIDVYTHDDMIVAHTFPYFDKYKNLKGQFGQGIENCLLDFSTFPGPIILTKHSLYNVENLYRGLLYTTDFAYSKGVISLKDGNLEPVINSALKSKGFKSGKVCEDGVIGYDCEKIKQKIRDKLSDKKYTNVIVIGLTGYSANQKEYCETLLKIVPDNIFVISLPCCEEKTNVITLNTVSDSYAINFITEFLYDNIDIPASVIFPQCDRHTISQMITISEYKNFKIFLGKCTPIMLNPTLINTLSDLFKIEEISTPKKDLEKMI